MPGPPPDPDRLTRGTGHKPFATPLVLSPGRPDRPTNLTPHGLELWDTVTAAYEARGMLDHVDQFQLFATCRLWEAIIDGQGGLTAYREFRGYCNDFGLNPAARMRLGPRVSKPAAPKDIRANLVGLAGRKAG